MSLSLLTIEVNCLIYPAFAIFLLMLIPIPFLSKWVARLVAKIESIRVGGISILLVIALTGLALFLFTLQDYQKHFGSGLPGSSSKGPAGAAHSNHADFGRHLSKKWREERNMYIHAILAILYAALLKMARLTLESVAMTKKLNKMALEGSTTSSPLSTAPKATTAAGAAAAANKAETSNKPLSPKLTAEAKKLD